MIECPKCRTQNLQDSHYCDNCGTKLITAEAPAADQTAQEQTALSQPASQKPIQTAASEAPKAEAEAPAAEAAAAAAPKRQRASLFTNSDSLLNKVSAAKADSPAQSVLPLNMQTGADKKDTSEILNIITAVITGIGVLVMCLYSWFKKFTSKK